MTRKTKATAESGVIYLNSTGQWYKAPKIDADKIMKYRENIYLKGVLDKQQRMLFSDKYKLIVESPDGEDATDKELQACAVVAAKMYKMCEGKDVRLWFSMQRAWRDVAEWGPALFNPVWDYEGAEYQLQKLRRLPPESFVSPGLTFSLVKNRILPGICLNEKTQTVEFYQKQTNSQQKKLDNVFMIIDPISHEIGGEPIAIPVYYILPMVDFSWQKQMQMTNRMGAGGNFFIKVTNPVGDDKEYAQKILKNISSNAAYQLRGNMEVIAVPITGNASAMETISALDRLIQNYFTPTGAISGQGSTEKKGIISSGGTAAEADSYMTYIKGTHAWVSEAFNSLLQPYLDANAYEEYVVKVEIPEPKVDRSQMYVGIARDGFNTKSIGLNDRRALYAKAGAEIEALDDAGIKALADEFKALGVVQGGAPASPQMFKASIVTESMKSDPLDPFSMVSKEKAKQIIQKALEEGES